MLKLKSEKGSIVLFVLISCLFFIASVACIQMYMQTKQTSVDREYRRIKENYEANLVSNESLNATYNKLSQKNIIIENTKREEDKITVELSSNNKDTNIETIKYGWGTGSSVDTVSDWTYIEKEALVDTIIVTNTNIEEETFHLFVAIDDKIFYSEIYSANEDISPIKYLYKEGVSSCGTFVASQNNLAISSYFNGGTYLELYAESSHGSNENTVTWTSSETIDMTGYKNMYIKYNVISFQEDGLDHTWLFVRDRKRYNITNISIS